MRETDLVVNVQSAVEDFYPGLTQKQKDLLSEKIYNNFDYSVIYNQIHDDLEHYAYSENIDLTDNLEKYVIDHSENLTDIQKEIIDHNTSLGDQKRLQISISQAQFLQTLIKVSNVKKILEIGSFTGFSALSMAMALPPDGTLISLDKNPESVSYTHLTLPTNREV